jgi:predicted 3-demethylubiquinone-9 3-methyltransferase (glyoxalase superfamily)
MFVNDQCGKAEEAIHNYTSIFQYGDVKYIYRYEKGEGDTPGLIKHAVFSLEGYDFMAMDSSLKHEFTFSGAISFFIKCETQEDIDDYWEKLSEGGEKEQCGWLEDTFGISWQVVPTILGKMLNDKDTAKVRRVTETMLKMTKIDIQVLKRAYEQ